MSPPADRGDVSDVGRRRPHGNGGFEIDDVSGIREPPAATAVKDDLT